MPTFSHMILPSSRWKSVIVRRPLMPRSRFVVASTSARDAANAGWSAGTAPGFACARWFPIVYGITK